MAQHLVAGVAGALGACLGGVEADSMTLSRSEDLDPGVVEVSTMGHPLLPPHPTGEKGQRNIALCSAERPSNAADAVLNVGSPTECVCLVKYIAV